MQFWLRLLLATLLLSLISYKAVVIPLPEGYKAVIAHFGDPNRIIETPGAHFKWPWPIDSFYLFDCQPHLQHQIHPDADARQKSGHPADLYRLAYQSAIALSAIGRNNNQCRRQD